MAPVTVIAAGFGPDATFEGRIMEELRRFEESGALRVVDVLFVRRTPGTDGQAQLTEAIAETGGAILQQGILDDAQARQLGDVRPRP